MNAVGVLINLPTNQLNSTFNYIIPEELRGQASFGKRVLLDFGGKINEAFILEEMDLEEVEGLKPLLKVLDQEPVFNETLLALARWMAEYYSASLAVVLSMMIPGLLHRQKAKQVMAGIDAERYYRMYHDGEFPHEELFKILWERGALSKSEALRYLSQEELKAMAETGMLVLSGVYQAKQRPPADSIYVLDRFDPQTDLVPLKKKAPRQAEAMELLLSKSGINQKQFNQIVSRPITQALLKKGYIRLDREANELINPNFVLNNEQKEAVRQLEIALKQEKYAEFLLFGVTGSGKTEVYLQAAQATIKAGRSVIILVPEIALTRQLVEVFSQRIPDIAVLHSGMPTGERYDQWKRIQRGEASLVLGPRSAVFAPVPRLGLIIMDEEQESTFKQEELPRYHARDVARQRAQMESAVMLLGSATPAIESYYRARQGEIRLLPLAQRAAGAAMPRVTIEDMKKTNKQGYRGLISLPLQERIKMGLSRGEQTILFINRRGYSPMTICAECGTIASCPFCSVGMTYHQDLNQNLCHYCNHHSVQKKECELCGSTHLQLLGSGTQKVEEEVHILFPHARIERLDMDSSRKKGAQKKILQAMKNKELDILIGTQMVAKGLDFPNVSLVGIVDADSILNLPDFRAAERCFQLLVQAAGRAGRADIPGEVLIQTYNPDAPVIQMAASQDYNSFYNEENRIRKLLDYPPYTELLRIVFHSDSDKLCREYSLSTALYIEEMIDAKEDDIMLLGPAPCPINKIRNRYRHQLIIKCASGCLLRSIAANIIKRGSPGDLRLEVDFNPMITM